MTTPRVALLGLGIMGGGMARRLLGAGIQRTVFNRNPARAEVLVSLGAKVGKTPREAAANAEVVLCKVADDVSSRAMWLGVDSALASAPQGAIVVDCSTLSIEWVKEIAEAANLCRCEFVDAPVTGSKGAAAAGELNFIIGGSAAALEKLRPELVPMSKSITHLGASGSGAFIKLINNFVCGVQVASIAEALALIEQSGIDRTKALSVLLDGAPGSPIVKLMVSRMTAPDFTPKFMVKLMAKDLSYALKAAGSRGLTPNTARAALDVFQRAIDSGHGDQDMSAVVEPLRKALRS